MFGFNAIKKMLQVNKPHAQMNDFGGNVEGSREIPEKKQDIFTKPCSVPGSETHRFSKPKIFMIDVPDAENSALKEKWSDISYGSLGQPYQVKKSAKYNKVVASHTVVGHEEADIVVIDLSLGEMARSAESQPIIPDEHRDIWSKLDYGYIDPRLIGAAQLQNDLDRIVRASGVCIIFADKKSPIEVVWGRVSRGSLNISEPVNESAWSILSAFHTFQISADQGETVSVLDDSPLGLLLERHIAGARYGCILDRGYYKEKWTVLAESKFHRPVAVVGSEGEGLIIVVPQLKEKISFVDDLLSNVLPEMFPHLFPEIEQRSWTRDSDYELPRIVELEKQKYIVKKNAEDKVDRISNEINSYRLEQGWVHDLLDGTGDTLVYAVKKALEEIGFSKVIDMDIIRDAECKQRREDLRVEDRSPLLIIDVKGVGGSPSDSDSTQANKHAIINMREMGRTDIQGLSIINHQRHLPPLSRDNAQTFRKEIVDVAIETKLGLMSSFDLYKMLIGMRKHSWPSKHVMDVFYGQGRIRPMPSHYEEIGKVGKVFSNMIGVHVTHGVINVGDRLALEGIMGYDEAAVESIQVEDAPVTIANIGDRAGFIWPSTNFKARDGMPVYRISAKSLMP